MLTTALVTPWLVALALTILLFSNRHPELWRRIRMLRLEVAHQAELVKRARRERDAALAAVARSVNGCEAPQRLAVEALERGEEEVCEAN